MAKITTVIPPQSFEIVRDQIGAILKDEVDNQAAISYNVDLEMKAVWVERLIPFDKTELPAINVSLLKGDPEGQSMIHVDGMYRYALDAYQSAPSTEDARGDVRATFKLHRLLGVMRAILEDPRYYNLGFTSPFIGARHVESLQIADVNKADGLSTVMGRLIFAVRVPETYDFKIPIPLAQSTAAVKLFLTEKGYIYTTT